MLQLASAAIQLLFKAVENFLILPGVTAADRGLQVTVAAEILGDLPPGARHAQASGFDISITKTQSQRRPQALRPRAESSSDGNAASDILRGGVALRFRGFRPDQPGGPVQMVE